MKPSNRACIIVLASLLLFPNVLHAQGAVDSHHGARSKAGSELPSNYQELTAALRQAVALERQEKYGPGPKHQQEFNILQNVLKTNNVSALLMKALDDPDSSVREGAIHAVWLQKLSSSPTPVEPENLPKLKKLCLEDHNPKARKWCASALAYFGSDAVAILVVLLKDSDSNVREAAAGSLGALGLSAVDALPALKELLHDDNSNVKSAAKLAINRVQGP